MKEGYEVVEVYMYTAHGYDDYYDRILLPLEKNISKKMRYGSDIYIIAISEAVCNAAKYAKAGPESVNINIKLRITMDDITTIIAADTKHFDVEHFRTHLRQLADDEIIGNMEWGDYCQEVSHGRGIWYMLMAVDYLIFDTSGKEVSLCTSRSLKMPVKLISRLVPRLLLKKNEVIY